jgi:hypothetical protein
MVFIGAKFCLFSGLCSLLTKMNFINKQPNNEKTNHFNHVRMPCCCHCGKVRSIFMLRHSVLFYG